MKRVLYILVFVFVYSFSAVAQKIELPDKVDAFFPDCLNTTLVEESSLKNISKENNYGQSSSNKTQKSWDVYSDRSKNPAYFKPNSSSGVANKLDFNQKVRIAKIENGFALVYEEPNTGGTSYPNISNEAKNQGALGWVPMDKLLLWKSCPANEFGILNKALLVYNLNKASNGNTFQRYDNPETLDNPLDIDYDVNFYFIMKRSSNGLVLLASEARMDGDTDQVLYGWVNESSYTPWNQRSCLEFNWKYRDLEGLKGDSVGFYADKDFNVVAANYHKYTLSDVTRIGKEKRFSGNILRLPILGNENGVYRITYFAPSNGTMSYDEAARVQEESMEHKNKKVENIKKMNLIIVVDGTQSMEPHFKSLYGAIKDACKKYADAKYNVKLGLVIYRDYKDVINGDSCYVEYVPMSPMNDAKLFKTFETGGKYGIKSSMHDDYAEVLYEGLYTALDAEKMKYSKEESNLIIVVGDCGNRWNDPRSPTLEDIKEKAYANNVNLISFQVHNMESDKTNAWSDYTDQMNELILDITDRQYSSAGLSGGFEVSDDGTCCDYKVNEGRSFYVASMRSPLLGESMPIDELGNLINQNVLLFTKAINTKIDVVNNAFSNYRSTLASGKQRLDRGWLENNLDAKTIELFEKRDMLLALDGYTPSKNKNGVDYYKTVLFIEHGEFERLLSQFRKVYEAAKNSDNRENYINAMKQLLVSLVPDMTQEELNKQGGEYIRRVISGLTESTDAFRDRSFEEIANVNIVTREEFNRIISEFKEKFRTLDSIYKRKYEYTFRSNNQVYYWIPFDDLP